MTCPCHDITESLDVIDTYVKIMLVRGWLWWWVVVVVYWQPAGQFLTQSWLELSQCCSVVSCLASSPGSSVSLTLKSQLRKPWMTRLSCEILINFLPSLLSSDGFKGLILIALVGERYESQFSDLLSLLFSSLTSSMSVCPERRSDQRSLQTADHSNAQYNTTTTTTTTSTITTCRPAPTHSSHTLSLPNIAILQYWIIIIAKNQNISGHPLVPDLWCPLTGQCQVQCEPGGEREKMRQGVFLLSWAELSWSTLYILIDQVRQTLQGGVETGDSLADMWSTL